MAPKTKPKRKPRGPAKPVIDRMARATDRVIVKVMTNGVPIKGPGGELIMGDDGKLVTAPPSAAFVRAAIARIAQLNAGIAAPRPGDKPTVGDMVAALQHKARVDATSGKSAVDDPDDDDQDDDGDRLPPPNRLAVGRR